MASRISWRACSGSTYQSINLYQLRKVPCQEQYQWLFTKKPSEGALNHREAKQRKLQDLQLQLQTLDGDMSLVASQLDGSPPVIEDGVGAISQPAISADLLKSPLLDARDETEHQGYGEENGSLLGTCDRAKYHLDYDNRMALPCDHANYRLDDYVTSDLPMNHGNLRTCRTSIFVWTAVCPHKIES